MEKKNQKMTVIVGALLLVIGISFSYFLASILINGNGANTKVTTAANIKGATINIEGTLEFDDVDILPGHKNVSSIKLTATGDNELVPYNLIWRGTNGLGTALNYTVYKTSSEIAVSANCTPQRKTIGGATAVYEECSITNENQLGSVVAKGTIAQSTTEAKTILAQDEFITATKDGDIKYYYVVLEYPNLDEAQNSDIGKGFEGVVTVEESNASPDIDILAVYTSEDGVNYTETQDIPQSGYALSLNKSTCNNGATVRWENNELVTSSLTKSGTSCYLYFNKLKTVTTALGDLQVNPEVKTSFNRPATGDEGIQTGTDYAGTTYYYRGNVTNNWVKFADFYWRIIRINGDGTIRMIYNGTTTKQTGETTQIGTKAFNSTYNSAEYVGLQYTLGEQRGTGTNSTVLGETNSTDVTTLYGWYNTKIKGTSYEKYVDTSAVFCSDRDVVTDYFSNYTGNGTGIAQSAFAPAKRVYKSTWFGNSIQTPVMTCSSDNQLRLPVGLITADELVFAGGFGDGANSSYYLYTNQDYWTMSPDVFYSGRVRSFFVRIDGVLSNNSVNNLYGVRPVINLKADTKLTGSGTSSNPYVVVTS